MEKIPLLDTSQCNMCLSCVEVCPEVFKEMELGFIKIRDMLYYPQRKVEEAIKYCPNDCIEWNTMNPTW